MLRTVLLLVIALVTAFVAAPATAGASGFDTYQPATIDRPVARHAGKHCTVTLLRDHGFADFVPVHSSYVPPSKCAPPWSEVVLDFETHIRGVQYDRIGMLWMGRNEIFRFSTAEPTRRGIRYHIDEDVTQYAPLFRASHPVVTLLGNLVNKEYTGVIYVTATLTFYEAAPHAPVARGPSEIIAVDGNHADIPSDDSGHLDKHVAHLPRNITRATLEVYATNHGCDEFWYSNQPDAFAAAHKKDGLCGGGAYREIDVRIDGRLAGVIAPFPYIWTGGINPLLWRPLSSIHALDVPPYGVELSPWAGVLSDGKPHEIELSVMNDRGSWPMDGNLFLWTDSQASRTSGAVVADTIATSAETTENQRPRAGGYRFWFGAQRAWRVKGYVDTSAGRVWHVVESRMRFRNVQFVNLKTGEGDATQNTTVETAITERTSSGSTLIKLSASYPLVANATYPLPAMSKPYSLVIESEVHQGLHERGTFGRCDETVDATATLKRIKPHVDAVARGRTSEVASCSGTADDFVVRKTARDGAIEP